MDILRLAKLNWLKALSPFAIAASLFLVTELPANADPHIPNPSSDRHSVYSSRDRRVSSPRSLNVTPPRTRSLNTTPPPGRHISLPNRSSRYRHYPSHGRYRRYDRHRRYNRRYDRHRRYNRHGRYNRYDRYDRYNRYDRYDRRRGHRNRRGYKKIIIINPALR